MDVTRGAPPGSRLAGAGLAALVLAAGVTVLDGAGVGSPLDRAAAAGPPTITASGVVVDGPSTGSTTTAEAGDVVEWTVRFSSSSDLPADGVTVTDLIGDGQVYVPGSLDLPGGGWDARWSSTPGALDPAAYVASPEPADVRGVGMAHPTNGFPAAVGGTASFPPPPAPSSSQTGTGGDGYEPIPLGANVYNIFHHQIARLYCTVKRTGARCADYPTEGFIVTPLATGEPMPTAATLTTGTTTLAVGSQPYIYADVAAGRLWVGGQLITYDGGTSGIDTGRVGFACIDQTTAVPTGCGWAETGTGAPPAYYEVGAPFLTARRDPTMTSAVAWPQERRMLGNQYASGDVSTITCLDVDTGAACPSSTVTWPEPSVHELNPGLAASDFLLTAQLGTTSRFVVSYEGASGTWYDLCYDGAAGAPCAGWSGPRALTTPGGYGWGAYASKALTTYDSAMGVTGYCHVWAQPFGLTPSPPATTCHDLSGDVVPTPAGWAAMWPEGFNWVLGMTYGLESHGGDTIGTRTYFAINNPTFGDDAVACFDWALPGACGGPYPLDLNPSIAAMSYELTVDDELPTCLWQLGHTGELYSFDAVSGGRCASTTLHLDVVPADGYCAATDPVVSGWEQLVLHHVAPTEYAVATLTLRDADGDVVPGWDAVDATADLADGLVDISGIPYGGTTTALSVEVRFDAMAPEVFEPPHPTPSLDVSWIGDPIELCFRTLVLPACDVTSIDDVARLTFEPAGGAPTVTSASASLAYVATDASCFELTKDVSGRTYHGDGRWELTYDIGVANTAAVIGRYDLDDALRVGAGIAVVTDPAPAIEALDVGTPAPEPTWTGAAPTTRAVSNASIAPSATHRYRVTVLADVPPDLDAEAADCAPGGDPGTGFSNTVTLQPGSADPATATACESPEVPAVGHTKSVESVTADEATGEHVVTYALTASATGAGLGRYDIDDVLAFGTGVTVVPGSATVTAVGDAPPDAVVSGWTGAAPDALAVDDAVIDSGETHTYLVSVRARAATPADVAVPCADGGGFANASTLTPLVGAPVEAAACGDAPLPTVTQTAALEGPPAYDPATGLWTVVYLVTATADGDGIAAYTLDDRLQHGAGVRIVSALASAAAPGTPPASATWDGAADTAVVTDAAIGAGQSHLYRLTVRLRADGGLGGGPGGCAAGADLSSRATLTVTGAEPEVDEACGALAHLSVDKVVVGTPAPDDTGATTVRYRIEVRNDGGAPASYDLADALQLGSGVDGRTAEVVDGPAGVSTNGSWNGGSVTALASDVTLPAGATHTYTVALRAVATTSSTDASRDCTLGADEGGTGLRNTVTVRSSGVELGAAACAPLARPASDGTGGGDTGGGTGGGGWGPLPATGGTIASTAQAAALVLLAGLGLVRLRRRTTSRSTPTP